MTRRQGRAGGDPTRVLVLGGGFAGLTAARRLQRLVRRDPSVQVTLVNRDNFSLFTPMLHEVAASDLDVTHIVNPMRRLLPNGTLFAGEIEQIDLGRRRVVVTHGDGGHQHELPYDHLVLALGAVTNFFSLPGVRESALTMRTLEDAIRLRNRVVQLLEEADFECVAGQRHQLLTFVVAGGGFAGVETVAGLNDFTREALRHYPHLTERDLRILLVEPGPVLLPELSPSLGRYAQRQLVRRQVDVRVDTGVTEVTERGVVLSDGTVVDTATLIWTAGSAPNPLVATLPCRKQRGRIVVDETLALPDFPGVWASGDCAWIPNGPTGDAHPPTAQHAIREGRLLAHNVAAAIRGGRPKPFSFATLGQLAAIGRRAGVAEILGLRFSGFAAWWLWRTIYLAKLPRLERKVRVALDWTLDLVFARDLVQLPVTSGMARGAPAPVVAGAQPRGQDLHRPVVGAPPLDQSDRRVS